MRLTFIIDAVEDPFGIDVDPSITFEDLTGLLEIELRIPADEQQIFHNGTRFQKAGHLTLSACGISTDEMMEIRRRKTTTDPPRSSAASASGSRPVAGGNIANDIDRMRLQLLGDPALMGQIRTSNPELAEAAEKSPEKFARLMQNFQHQHDQGAQQRRIDEELLHSDPYDIEAQKRIEEHIRQERVWENMQHAIEFSPESFGRVTMLYVDVEVNGHPIKAFVDSGAQMTIMSPSCAQEIGIMRLIDTRFSGIATGVGTAKILGRVHSAQLKMADLHLPCSFTIMEGKGVALLFGLDMLKRHQAVIDLSKNALIIQGRELKFLSEHELPTQEESVESNEEVKSKKDQSIVDVASKASSIPPQTSASSSASSMGLSEEQNNKVQTLIGLGSTQEEAEGLLRQAGWDVGLAASMMFPN